MSKLDEIGNRIDRAGGMYFGAKTEIKDLILELVNTTSTMTTDGKDGNVEWVHYEKLRQKVEKL